MPVTEQEIEAGQAVYTRPVLAAYDWYVLGITNRFIWKCPTPQLLQHYNRHVTANHLDVGVGTGYFLDRCRFATESPRIGLMDLNATALAYAAQRIARYRPKTYQRNVLAPIAFDDERFDSVGINFLLHCLPGDMAAKAVTFDHLKALMNPGATLFGSTVLQGDAPRSLSARSLMAIYNRKGIFSNRRDEMAVLERELKKRFAKVDIELKGCVALFNARD